MRYRWLVLVVSALVIASNVWLYDLVQRDYIPTNVDESEFEIRVETEEGASMVSTDEAMRVAEKFLLEEPGVETVLTTVGGRGTVNRGEMFVRLADIETRTFSLGRLFRGLLDGDPGEAFRGNFSQQEKMVAVRKRLGSLPGMRLSVRNLTSLRQGAPVDIDFAITGPDLLRLAQFADALKERAEEIPGIVDLTTTLQPRQAGAARGHQPRAGGHPRGRCPRDRRHAPRGRRRRRPGLALPGRDGRRCL